MQTIHQDLKGGIHPCIALPTTIESEGLFPGAIVIEPEKQNNASPTVLAHAKWGQNTFTLVTNV